MVGRTLIVDALGASRKWDEPSHQSGTIMKAAEQFYVSMQREFRQFLMFFWTLVGLTIMACTMLAMMPLLGWV